MMHTGSVFHVFVLLAVARCSAFRLLSSRTITGKGVLMSSVREPTSVDRIAMEHQIDQIGSEAGGSIPQSFSTSEKSSSGEAEDGIGCGSHALAMTVQKEAVQFIVAASMLCIFFASPQNSFASYGSGGAAVQSPPPISMLSVQDYLSLSNKKQLQRTFALTCANGEKVCDRSIDKYLQEIDEFQKKFDELEEKVLAKSAEEEEALSVEDQLKARQIILNKLEEQPAWISYTAAALGSVCSTLIMHPLDTLKTRRMSSTKAEGKVSADDDGNIENVGAGAAMALKSAGLVTDLGGIPDIRELYSGVTANLVKEAPPSAVYLGVYEAVRKMLTVSPIGTYPYAVYLLSGAAGEVIGSILRAPAEAVKTKIQTSDVTPLEALKLVFSPAGIARTVKGWKSSVYRDVPYGGIQLAMFEAIRTIAISSPLIDIDVGSFQAEALFGAIAGGLSAFITTPFDRVTTVILSAEDGSAGREEGEDSGSLELSGIGDMAPIDVAKAIIATEGVAGLFKGSVQRGLYWAPAIGIFLSVYCTIRKALL